MPNNLPAPGVLADRPPWRGLLLVVALGFVARVAVALASLNVPYPDEIFQYLEQGHRLAFGYGLVPWEFREGARSWLVPGGIAVVLRALDAVGLGWPAAYLPILRGLFCLLSLSVVVSGYVLGRRLFGETAGRLAALFSALWYELVYFAHKPLSDALGSYALLTAFACLAGGNRRWRPYGLGILAATAAVLRVQLLPASLFLLLVVLLTDRRQARARSILGFVAIVLLAGLFDQATWGGPFASYARNYHAIVAGNLIERFGQAPWWWYFGCLLVASAGLFAIAVPWALLRLRKTWIVVGALAAIVVPHAAIPHKEYRFVLAAIPFALLLLACLVQELAQVQPARARRVLGVVGFGFLAISALGLCRELPGQSLAYDRPLLSRQPGLEAYLRLAREPHVMGVLDLYQGWWASGGAVLMHKPVPLYHGTDLQSGVLPRNDIHRYVSHLLCKTGQCRAEGFRVAAQVGDAELLVQVPAPPREPNPRYRWDVFEQEVTVTGPRRQQY